MGPAGSCAAGVDTEGSAQASRDAVAPKLSTNIMAVPGGAAVSFRCQSQSSWLMHRRLALSLKS